MPAHTTDYKGDLFSLCCGDISENCSFEIVYRNTLSSDQMNGNISQWIYIIEGSGKLIIDGVTDITYYAGNLYKMPNLYRKKVLWRGLNDGTSWVSFNPNPHTDDYDAAKIDVKDTVILESANFVRHLVLFEGDCITTNQSGQNKKLNENSTIRIMPGSTITLTPEKNSVVGLFWKSDELI